MSKVRSLVCVPEFNCDEMCMITPPDFSGGLRSSGGHIHLSRSDFETAKDDALMIDPISKNDLIKLLDYFLATPFVIIDNDHSSAARRKLYGRPGSLRPTPYGARIRYS